MGLLLDVRCEDCGYERSGLRLGATHAQIEAHDVSTFELFATPCCGEVQSVLVYMGKRYPRVPCEGCAQAFEPSQEARFRVSTMKGEVLSGHTCPRCGAPRLGFTRRDTFK